MLRDPLQMMVSQHVGDNKPMAPTRLPVNKLAETVHRGMKDTGLLFSIRAFARAIQIFSALCLQLMF